MKNLTNKTEANMSGKEMESAFKQIKNHLHQKGVNDDVIKNFVELITKMASSLYIGADEWKKEYGVKDDPDHTVQIPENSQYIENRGWETSDEFTALDSDDKDKEYFLANYDLDSLGKLYRKMENVMMERGLSMFFVRSFAHASAAFDKLEAENNEK